MKKIFLSLILALGITSTFYQLSQAHFYHGRYRGYRTGCCGPRYRRYKGCCCPGYYRGGWGFFGRGARYYGGYYRGYGHHGYVGHHGHVGHHKYDTHHRQGHSSQGQEVIETQEASEGIEQVEKAE